jgi:hypothetical protein
MRGFAGFLVALAMQGCSMSSEPSTDYSHSNGLYLKLPATLSVHRRSDGFVVSRTASLQSRAPEQVFVALHQSASAPIGEWLKTKNIAGRVFRYRLERNEGGSAGENHILIAWCSYADGYVQMTQVSQAEWPTAPNHTLAWIVMAGIGDPQSRDIK